MTTNYIWRKSATKLWLEQNEPKLEQVTSGSHAVVERPGRDRIQIELFCERSSAARNLLNGFGGSVSGLPRDWQKQLFAAANITPLRIGKRLTIVSDAKYFVANSPANVLLLIPAGMAFGTGDHASTAMSLRMLERLSRSRPAGWRMFDAGTGSGILALAASRFGAREVVAIDDDPMAIATAKQNAQANRISGVRFVIGDIRQPLRGRFDLIMANLYSDLLVAMLPTFGKNLARAGRLILSGVLRQQEPELAQSLRVNRFRINEVRRRGKWIALAASHAAKT